MTTPQSARQTAAVYRPPEASKSSAPAPAAPTPAPWRLLSFPAVIAVVIASFALFTRDAVLESTFVGTAAVLLVWCVTLLVFARRTGRSLSIEVVRRPQHWVQACGQGALILYWATYNHFVFGFFPFIFAELLFAYSFDSLLSWSRRDRYTLGFGPFSVCIRGLLQLLIHIGEE